MAPSLLTLTLLHLLICNQVLLSLAVQQSNVFNSSASITSSSSSSSSLSPLPTQLMDGKHNTLHIASSSPPAPPTNLQVLIINISSLRLLWDYPTTDQSTQFLVQALSQDFNNSYQNISGLLNSTHFTYNGTRIGSYYIFQVIAYQGGVASSPSHPTRIFENASTAPTGPPDRLTVLSYSRTSVDVIWDNPKPSIDRVYTYHLFQGDAVNNTQEVDIVTDQYRYTYTGLSPNSLYYFAVQADISGIKSVLSDVINQTTRPVSLSPLDINVIPNVTMATISWSLPSSSQYDRLQYFLVYYAVEALLPLPLDGTAGFKSAKFSDNSTCGTVSGLEEGVVYVFMGFYYADNTLSEFPEPVTAQMLSSVECHTCRGLTKSELEITWTLHSSVAPLKFSIISPNCTNTSIVTSNSTASVIVGGQSAWTHCVYYVMMETQYNYSAEPSVCPTQECITLQDKPSGCPLDFHINATSSHNISVSWDEVPVDERNGPITSYVIAAYRVRGGEQRLFQRKSSPSVLSGFSPNTEYEIMIVAVNEIGLGPSSCPMQYVTTMEDKPTGPPLNITLISATNTSLSISWSPPSLETRNGLITYYNVSYYCNSTRTTLYQVVRTYNSTLSNTSVIISNLLPSTGYEISVQASTVVGTGPWSSPIVFKTLTYSVPLPQIAGFSSASTSHNPFTSCYAYKVSWELNSTRTGRVLSKTLTYYALDTGGLNNTEHGSIEVNGDSVVLTSKILKKSEANYTISLLVVFQLENGTVLNVTVTETLQTSSCLSSVITVGIVASVVFFFILLLGSIPLCICCAFHVKRTKRLSHRPYGIPMVSRPSVPNEYITSIRRADGQSDDGRFDSSSSISYSNHDNLSNTPTNSTVSMSQEDEEDVPLLSVTGGGGEGGGERTGQRQNALPESMVYRYDDYVVPIGVDDGMSVVSDLTMGRRLVPDGSSFSSISDDESITSAPEAF